MKKRLEADLMSIAHRVLQIKDKSDVTLLCNETRKLYEKLAILQFVEEHFGDAKPTIGQAEIVEKMKQFFEELFSSTARQETIRKQTANYILPISKNDMVTLFPDCSVLAADIGLDYAIWNNVWKVSPLFAKILWYTGLLSSNCFGIVEKKKSFLL